MVKQPELQLEQLCQHRYHRWQSLVIVQHCYHQH